MLQRQLHNHYQRRKRRVAERMLTFTYQDTYPSFLQLGDNYAGPADPSKALYNSGNGWQTYTSHTIPVTSRFVSFKGDWRDVNGTFNSMFNTSFKAYEATIEGGFDVSGAPVPNMFRSTFAECNKLVGAIPSTLFEGVEGSPSQHMCYYTFQGCSGLTSVPGDLFSGIAGAPVQSMFLGTFQVCSNLTSVPGDLFSGIAGAPALYMYAYLFSGCSRLASIPVGLFGDIAGPPAQNMFFVTFQGCSALAGQSALMSDGVTHLYAAFPDATSFHADRCYENATGLSDYDDIPDDWK